MRTIAFYLPQFHRIPENDKWWGEGFTEWSNVRNAKSFFSGHQQPEIPMGNNYYCILDDGVMKKQAEMACEYGVDAFCYYHYWFEGKMLLEKPLEKMLHDKEIKIPFCICWANETWSRTWDGSEEDVLIKQNYDENEKDWKKHFDYLVDFFNDDRYLLKDNKPILLIYKPHLMKKSREMLEYWRTLAKEAGFDGLYIGFQHHSAFDYDMTNLGLDFGVEFEPMYTVREINLEKKDTVKVIKRWVANPKWLYRKILEKTIKTPKIYYYDEIWKRINKRLPINENIMPGAFCSWDNTPRMKNKSTVFLGATPRKFENYFRERIKRNDFAYHADFIFINAWNEWAEGAHLEPDERNGYGYLKALKKALERVV